MDSWDDLRFLLAVAKTGSMTAAAGVLHTSVATVSRRMDKIATRLGAAPFVKTSDGWAPSAAVSGLIDLAMTFEGNLKREINALHPNADSSAIDLRLGCTPTVLTTVLIPGLSLRGPQMDRIHLEFGERIFGEGLGDFDILISYAAPKSGRALIRKAAEVDFAVYGPPGSDVSGDWVGLTEPHDGFGVMRVGFETFDKPPAIRTDSLIALSRIMQETGLPGPLPELLAREMPGLQPIGNSRFRADFWISYHESRRGDPAIDATLAWVDACFDKAGAAAG